MAGQAPALIARVTRGPAPAAPPAASIIVLARHSPRRLERCLTALARLADSISREVLVLLNGADEGLRATADRFHHDLPTSMTVFESPLNLGFAAGCNALARAAVGRYLVFLNDDTEVEQGWLDALVEVADRDRSVGAVGSCILFPDGSVQEAGSIVWRDGSILSLGRGVRPDSPTISYVRQVDYCSACSLLVPRHAWDAVGGFCEEYFPAYYEDVDLCFSLRALGYRVMYAPRSRLMHEGGCSTEPRFRLFVNDRHRQRFRQRWEPLLSTLEPPAPASPAAVRRAAFRARGCPRRLLVIGEGATQLPAHDHANRLRSIAAAVSDTYGVSLWSSSVGNETMRELSLYGVEIIDGDLARHVNEPGVLYDAVLVLTPHDFSRYESLIRQSQPHSVLIYDAARLHHRRRHDLFTSAADAASSVGEASAMRGLEETLRARADFVTCASADVEAFFSTTVGVAPLTIVSTGRGRAAAAALVSNVPRAVEITWSTALSAAQLRRGNKTQMPPDNSVSRSGVRFSP
jgi:GT2 family glycosyltransferase